MASSSRRAVPAPPMDVSHRFESIYRESPVPRRMETFLQSWSAHPPSNAPPPAPVTPAHHAPPAPPPPPAPGHPQPALGTFSSSDLQWLLSTTTHAARVKNEDAPPRPPAPAPAPSHTYSAELAGGTSLPPPGGRQILLEQWHIARRASSKSVEGVIQVLGVKRADGKQCHSSAIAERRGPGEVITASGTVYVLVGQLGEKGCEGFKPGTEDLFRHGFPENWLDILRDQGPYDLFQAAPPPLPPQSVPTIIPHSPSKSAISHAIIVHPTEQAPPPPTADPAPAPARRSHPRKTLPEPAPAPEPATAPVPALPASPKRKSSRLRKPPVDPAEVAPVPADPNPPPPSAAAHQPAPSSTSHSAATAPVPAKRRRTEVTVLIPVRRRKSTRAAAAAFAADQTPVPAPAPPVPPPPARLEDAAGTDGAGVRGRQGKGKGKAKEVAFAPVPVPEKAKANEKEAPPKCPTVRGARGGPPGVRVTQLRADEDGVRSTESPDPLASSTAVAPRPKPSPPTSLSAAAPAPAPDPQKTTPLPRPAGPPAHAHSSPAPRPPRGSTSTPTPDPQHQGRGQPYWARPLVLSESRARVRRAPAPFWDLPGVPTYRVKEEPGSPAPMNGKEKEKKDSNKDGRKEKERRKSAPVGGGVAKAGAAGTGKKGRVRPRRDAGKKEERKEKAGYAFSDE